MIYHIDGISENISEIKCMLTNLSIDNLKWSCLFSGMGIITPLTQKDIEHFTKLSPEGSSIEQLLSYYTPLNCIYSKGRPIFAMPPSEIINPGKYMWDFKSFSKKLDLSTQAFAILSLCTAAEILYETNRIEGALMVKSACMIYDFLSTYLRNYDGLYVSGEDKTKGFEKEYDIEIDEKESNPIDQIYVLEAALYLYRLTSDQEKKGYYTSKNQKYYNDAESLIDYIYENHKAYMVLDTRDISMSISSLSRCSHIASHHPFTENIILLICFLSAELETRVEITGEVKKGLDEASNASMLTHFRAGSALLEGYAGSELERFMHASVRIYSNLMDFYNSANGVFDEGNSNQINYSIRDIAEIIKNLLLHNMVCDNEQSVLTLKEFYNSAIEKSGIIQSIVKSTISFNDIDIFINSNLPLMDEINKAPVFLKDYKIKIGKKSSLPEVSKSFHSMYSLYSCYTFLYYLNFPFNK